MLSSELTHVHSFSHLVFLIKVIFSFSESVITTATSICRTQDAFITARWNQAEKEKKDRKSWSF